MKLGQTDLVQNVNIRLFWWDRHVNSVGPISLGLGHKVISVRPISVIGKQRVGQANSVGPIRSSRLDLNVTKGKQRVCIAISVGPIAHLIGPKHYEGK